MFTQEEQRRAELVALVALRLGVVESWQDAYLISHGKGRADLPGKNSVASTSARWKNSARTAELFKEAESIVNAKLREHGEREKEREGEREREERRGKVDNKPGKAAQIDYNDPKERRRAYNRIIAESQDDPKTQLDALKVIEGLQKDDRQAAKDAQIQRFYTPLKCQNCPLYTKAKKTTL